MSHLLAIGTRKGLWLARSDDRVTWTLDGPHHLMEEVASVAIDTRRDTPRILAGVMSWHWGPTLVWSDDLGATWHETENAAIRFPEDTGAALGRVWQLQPDSAERPDVVWAGCEPTSLWRSDDRGETFSLVRGLWDHPHRTEWAPGFGGAAVHTVLPDRDERAGHRRDEHRRRLHLAPTARTGWTPRNRGIQVSSCPTRSPSTASACTRWPSTPATRAGCTRRTTAASTAPTTADESWISIADGLPADFGFVVLASPHTPGTAWVLPLEADARRIPPGGRMRVHRTTRRRRHVDRARRRAARRLVHRRAARRRVRRRSPTPPASTSAPATAASTRAPTRARPSRSSPSTCPTCCPCAPRRSEPRWRQRSRCGCRRCSPSSPAGRASLEVEPAPSSVGALLRRARRAVTRRSSAGCATRRGALRRFVNVYVGDDDVRSSGGLVTALSPTATRSGCSPPSPAADAPAAVLDPWPPRRFAWIDRYESSGG